MSDMTTDPVAPEKPEETQPAEEPKAEEPKAEEPKAEEPKKAKPKKAKPKKAKPKKAAKKAAPKKAAPKKAKAAAPKKKRKLAGVPKKKTCPKCGATGLTEDLFGTRKMPVKDDPDRRVAQSYCKKCRGKGKAEGTEAAPKKAAPKKAAPKKAAPKKAAKKAAPKKAEAKPTNGVEAKPTNGDVDVDQLPWADMLKLAKKHDIKVYADGSRRSAGDIRTDLKAALANA